MGIFAHREQILRHHDYWDKKPALRQAYSRFYHLILAQLSDLPDRKVVELGSGIGNIKETIPYCITTDMFPTPWSDRVENAYHLSFEDGTISDLILVDVFHHLQFPGTALAEFHRVLRPGGRVLLFEPCISVLGLFVYGLFHQEGVKLRHPIQWQAGPGQSLANPEYYTSQGNATKIFLDDSHQEQLKMWADIRVIRLSALAYLASGGYTKPQLLADGALPALSILERFFNLFPGIFATRMLVVLPKPSPAG